MTDELREEIRRLDDALEALELRGEIAGIAEFVLRTRPAHRRMMVTMVHRAHEGDENARDWLWLTAHALRRTMACCEEPRLSSPSATPL